MTRIGITFGGPSPEHDVSILTGLQSARSLTKAGEDVVCLYWTKDGRWWMVSPDAEASDFLDPDLAHQQLELTIPGGFVARGRLGRGSSVDMEAVLNCCHGGPGEDGTLTAMLNLAGLRTTGPSAQACAVLMDKLATNALAAACGIPTIETVLWNSNVSHSDLPLGPWIAKPRFGGSSLGVEADISDLQTLADLSKRGPARSGLLVQPYLKGWTDLNISVRGHPSLELSPIERPLRPDGNSVYGYEDKYLSGEGMQSAPRELPAQIPDQIAGRVRAITQALAMTWGPAGATRVDYLWDGGEDVRLCEVNAIPGSWGAYLWSEAGISRETLLGDLIAEALSEPATPPQWAPTSTGTALRAAGTISSKLA